MYETRYARNQSHLGTFKRRYVCHVCKLLNPDNVSVYLIECHDQQCQKPFEDQQKSHSHICPDPVSL